MAIFQSDIVLANGDVLQIESGETLSNVTVDSGGSMVVLTGGTATATTVNFGGWIYVSSRGTADTTTVNPGGGMTVFSGGTANGITVDPGGKLYIFPSGTATEVTENGGYVKTYDDACATFAANSFTGTVLSDASATVHSGTTAFHTEIHSNSYLNVFSGGTANNTTIDSTGRLYVYTGGSADLTTVNAGGLFYLGLEGYGSGGTANNTTVNAGGTMFVSKGGTANGATVNFRGSMLISSGGSAADTTVNSGGSIRVSSGGTANGTVVNSGGRLYICIGGTATDIVWTPGIGAVQVEQGGVATYASQYSGVYYDSNNDLASHADRMESKTVGGVVSMYVYSGGTADNTTVNSGGSMYVRADGIANSTTVFSSGRISISSGGVANSTTVSSGGSMVVWNSGTVNDVDLYGMLFLSGGGTACRISVNSRGIMDVVGGTVTEIRENGGYVTVAEGAEATFISNAFSGLQISNGDSATVHSGTTANSTTVNNGRIIVFSGGTANGTMLNSGGKLHVSSGGTANKTTLYGREGELGSMSVSEGGVADGIVINGSGNLAVVGGTATNILASREAQIEIGRLSDILIQGAYDDGSTFSVKDSVASGFILNGVAAEINDGELLQDSFVKMGQFIVLSGGTANRIKLGNGNPGIAAILDVFSGGTATGINVNSNATFRVGSGGMADDTMLYGQIQVSHGATVNNTVIGSHGYLHVYGSGTANGITVHSGGRLHVYNGATVAGIVENGGCVTVAEGAEATFISNAFSGLIIGYGDSATVHSGTTANSTTINKGELIVFSGGLVNGVTVNPGGNLQVSGGGKLTGRIVCFGGSVSGYEGAILDFDLTQTAPGTGARISDLAKMAGTWNWTLTVDADQAEGVYTLAEGAAGFARTITVNNTVGDNLGTLTVGGTAVISGRDYALSLSDGGQLSLKIGEAAVPSSPYTSDGLPLARGAFAVEDGETFHDTMIGITGSLCVNSGGSVDIATVCNRGSVFVSAAASADGVTVFSGGLLSVLDGGSANDAVVHAGGKIFVSSGGTATGIRENGGFVSVEEGADVSFASNVFSGGILSSATLHSGTTACGATVSGTVHVSGGVLESALLTLDAEARIYVYEGGTVDRIDSNVNGSMQIHVSSGGTVSNTVLLNRGRMYVSSGGTAVNTVIYDSKSIFSIKKGAVMDSTTVNAGVKFNVSSGATATNIIENGGLVRFDAGAEVSFASNTFTGVYVSGGEATVHSGTTAVRTWLDLNGKLTVYDGGVANETLGGSTCIISISSGGTANSTTLIFGGSMLVSSGGTAADTIVESKGMLKVFSGGTADRTMVNADGKMYVFAGGKVTGKMVFEAGAVVSVNEGGIIDFDLTQAEAGGAALVNDLSIIQGAPLFTLTVDDDLKPGSYVYTLADGAAEFNGTISVVNKAGDTLGMLSVGGMVKIGYDDYTLNLADGTLSVTVNVPDLTPQTPVGTAESVSWESPTPGEEQQFVVEYSTDNFEHVIQVVTTGTAVDTPDLPAGTYQWRVKADDNSEWAVGEEIVSEAAPDDAPKVVQAVEDGSDDLFFAMPNGMWSRFYYAQHVGSINDWNGTNELLSAGGRGRIRNLFFGSADPNVLCLTDADNGDAIFVDDAYTGLPEEIEANTARLYRIQEIRAGAGDDIVDMTSQRCEYTGDGLAIRGGDGDDVIWANKGENMLFGDAGNDRIVGASGNDVIVGGTGNDTMHGGGGDDIFTFCDNWGTDTVKQLEDGFVTLWFASGSEENWNAETLTYTDGENSVTVSGVSAEQITLLFGDYDILDHEMFDTLSELGAFDAFTSRRVFEESGQGALASL